MFNINEIFYANEQYAERAEYCNDNNLMIVEIEPDEKGRRFQIQEVPPPSEEEQLEELRYRREVECFSIINQNFIVGGKSVSWFDTLTPEQKADAYVWVQEWRDVTKTKVIPTKPSWVK